MVAGCIDKGACLSSHQDTVLIPQYMTICDANGMCTMQFMYSQPVEQTMCDKWEFP